MTGKIRWTRVETVVRTTNRASLELNLYTYLPRRLKIQNAFIAREIKLLTQYQNDCDILLLLHAR